MRFLSVFDTPVADEESCNDSENVLWKYRQAEKRGKCRRENLGLKT